MKWLIAVSFALASGMLGAYALVPETTPYRVVQVQNGGTIAGTVTLDGPVPKVRQLATNKNPEVCGETVPDPKSTIVNSQNKGVQWVLLYLTNVSAGKAPPDTFVLNNHDCQFGPHVFGAVQGKTFVLTNKDPILHNTHIRYSSRSMEDARRTVLNVALSFHESDPQYHPIVSSRVLRRGGWLSVQCDAHDWMQGYGLIFDHPYFAVTDGDGKYELTDVPPGDYTLTLWHENLGTQTAQVTVKSGATATADFVLKTAG